MQPNTAASRTTFFPLRLFIFWMLLFQAARFFFLLSLAIHSPEILQKNWPAAFWYALRPDFSATCYLTAIPLLFYVIQLFLPSLKQLIRIVVGIELFFVMLLLIVNHQLYKAWGTLINRRAITFLADPGAIMASLSGLQLAGSIIAFAVLYFFAFRIYRLLVIRREEFATPNAINFIKRFVWLLLIPIGIRGGFQQIPINESAASYSEDQRLNSMAMNPFWYFGNNLIKTGLNQKNVYHKMPDQVALQIFHELMPGQQETTIIFNKSKPNIVFIALESWTADLIAPLGGDSASTPFFNSLCKEGLLFTSIYSSGRRTDQMFPSVLSGFPAQPNHSIVRFPSKTERLPMISRDLKASGYITSFYYGGELGFANMRTYLLQGKFDRLISKDDFSELNDLNKWGAHDQYVLGRHANDLNTLEEPFFSFLLTLSTHEPFDVPGMPALKSNTEPAKFRNSATYTDRCLREYFNTIRMQPYYANTIFVLFADHGHLLPNERMFNDPAVYHIPVLICGGALKPEFRGKTIASIGSQHDIPSTILNQLNMPDSSYTRSNNLLNEKRVNFAYFNMDQGAGWKDDDGTLIWSGQDTITVADFTNPPKKADDHRMQRLTAYLQLLFGDFLKN